MSAPCGLPAAVWDHAVLAAAALAADVGATFVLVVLPAVVGAVASAAAGIASFALG